MSIIIDRLEKCPCCGGRLELIMTAVQGHTGREIGKRFATFCLDGLGKCDVIIHEDEVDTPDKAIEVTNRMVKKRMLWQGGIYRRATEWELNNL